MVFWGLQNASTIIAIDLGVYWLFKATQKPLNMRWAWEIYRLGCSQSLLGSSLLGGKLEMLGRGGGGCK